MNNYQTPYQPATASQYNNYGQIQQMFPHPQGSVYSISNPSEIGLVPIGSTGLSIALCFPEELMYIKSFQNGNPIIMAYKVTPFAKTDSAPTPTQPAQETALDVIIQRLEKIEKQISTTEKGDKFNGLL